MLPNLAAPSHFPPASPFFLRDWLPSTPSLFVSIVLGSHAGEGKGNRLVLRHGRSDPPLLCEGPLI